MKELEIHALSRLEPIASEQCYIIYETKIKAIMGFCTESGKVKEEGTVYVPIARPLYEWFCGIAMDTLDTECSLTRAIIRATEQWLASTVDQYHKKFDKTPGG